MSLRFAVVHEAVADFEIATELADRVLGEQIDWLEEDWLPHQRVWLAENGQRVRLTWSGIKQLALEAGVRAHGHFEGEAALPDATAARRAILYLQLEFPELDAILLIRDQDDQPDRREGLAQARRQNHGSIVIVVGLAVVERECWVICGFDPRDEAERARLEQERQQLGFDPREQSHELTACKNDRARRSAKRVLRALLVDDRDRERCCWRETALSVLRERGDENGLLAYLEEIRALLCGLIGG